MPRDKIRDRLWYGSRRGYDNIVRVDGSGDKTLSVIIIYRSEMRERTHRKLTGSCDICWKYLPEIDLVRISTEDCGEVIIVQSENNGHLPTSYYYVRVRYCSPARFRNFPNQSAARSVRWENHPVSRVLSSLTYVLPPPHRGLHPPQPS